jgi:hypothetical protein
VSYHETFWVAAAAAAPVIALANQLAITTASRMMFTAPGVIVRTTWKLLFVFSLASLVLQTVALAAALNSLSVRHDSLAPLHVAAIEFEGLLAVGVAATVLGLFGPGSGGSQPEGRKFSGSSDDCRARARARVVKSVSISGGRGSRRQ